MKCVVNLGTVLHDAADEAQPINPMKADSLKSLSENHRNGIEKSHDSICCQRHY
jgi:hypothetical protein